MADWRERAKKWLKPRDNGQHLWAIRYLGREGRLSRQRHVDESNYDFLVFEFERSPGGVTYIETLRKMKRAWSQKKAREGGGGLKPYSYMLSKQFGSRLRRLSKRLKMTRREVLEKVVLEYEAISGSEAWLDLGRKSLANRLDDAKRMVEDQKKKSKELERMQKELELRDEALKNLEKYQDLVADLLADYTGMVKAHSQGAWVISRRATTPSPPLACSSPALRKHYSLLHYQELAARLDR